MVSAADLTPHSSAKLRTLICFNASRQSPREAPDAVPIDTRPNHADWARILALQDVAQRDRTGRVHGTGARPRRMCLAQRPPRAAPAIGARLPRHAGRAWIS